MINELSVVIDKILNWNKVDSMDISEIYVNAVILVVLWLVRLIICVNCAYFATWNENVIIGNLKEIEKVLWSKFCLLLSKNMILSSLNWGILLSSILHELYIIYLLYKNFIIHYQYIYKCYLIYISVFHYVFLLFNNYISKY